MCQIKAPIAGNSKAIVKIGNAAMRRSALAHFNKQMLIHELIRGSLIKRIIYAIHIAICTSRLDGAANSKQKIASSPMQPQLLSKWAETGFCRLLVVTGFSKSDLQNQVSKKILR
jgi:hypothetical protein